MIPYLEALKEVNYQFDCMGACSMVTVIDPSYGKLDFHWEGNKSKIRLSFVSYCDICICEFSGKIECDCEWIAFHEGPQYPSKIFTKAQAIKLKEPTLF